MKDRKNNISILLTALFSVVLLIGAIGFSYAYFLGSVTGEGNNNEINTFNKTLQITFVDTSNVSLIGAYTGDSLTKTFTIKNTGTATTYYNIYLANLTNNFANPQDLVYTISSNNNGAIVKETIVPTTQDNVLATAIKIDPGVTQSYTMKITFLKTDEDQSNNQNKTFSARIALSPTIDIIAGGKIFSPGSIAYAILDENSARSESNIDFSSSAVVDGLYYTNDSIDGSTVYFFRGGKNGLNNTLIFAGYCWKIIRITEDNGVRIIYDDSLEVSGDACVAKSEMTDDPSLISSYNSNDSYNAYVGYKFGEVNSSSYDAEHANINDSVIKNALDNWYANELQAYSSYIADSYYCNNRKTEKFILGSVVYGKNGYSNNNTGYSSMKRLLNYSPSYNCYNQDDIFTVDNVRGNYELTNPIALISADEAFYAGLTFEENTDNYLNNGLDYWTMTPAYFAGTDAQNMYISSTGEIKQASVATSYSIRPVITLKQDTIVISGDGSIIDPFKIN